ncbi:MAG: hypothetical protein HY909_12980 [Deltaproteobacteria bacterium]|nr:hypothetical protein [Deltaproteobacteria bacterium]
MHRSLACALLLGGCFPTFPDSSLHPRDASPGELSAEDVAAVPDTEPADTRPVMDALDTPDAQDTAPPPPVDSATDTAVAPPDAEVDAPEDAAMVDAGRPLDPWEALFAMNFRPSASPTRWANAPDAAYHCLAAASALRRGQRGAAFTPAFQAQLRDATEASVRWLADNAPRWGGSGWGLTAAFDAFGDGTTNPADTVYAFETGLAVWCLAEAADVLVVPMHRTRAQNALAAYRRAFVTRAQEPRIGCLECGYFWHSLNMNDHGRFVKYSNVALAVASLAVDRYGADATARSQGLLSAGSQRREVQADNYGYLGRFDRLYTAAEGRSFDDHNAFEAYALLRAGELVGDDALQMYARLHFEAYAARGSASQVAYAACHFARTVPSADRTCRAYIDANGATNAAGVGLVMDYRR